MGENRMGMEMMDELRGLLQKAKNVINTQAESIESLTNVPAARGVVIKTTLQPLGRLGEKVKIGNKKVMIQAFVELDGELAYEVLDREQNVSTHKFSDLKSSGILKCSVLIGGEVFEINTHRFIKAGDTVAINKEMSIMGPSMLQTLGPVALVTKLIDADTCQIEHDGSQSIAYKGNTSPEVGDQVVLSGVGAVIVKNLGPVEVAKSVVVNDTDWDQVIGQSTAKSELIDAVETPRKYRDLFLAYGRKPTKGILLYGFPGCGKTMLGKAAETSIRKASGSTVSGFVYIKSPELLSRYVGDTEALVKALFDNAKKFKTKTGNPQVIFFDEADALLQKRGSGISTDISNTIVPTFLVEMDGIDESAALVILATNRPDQIDDAVLRDGRIDRKICVGRPNLQEVGQIIALNLKKIPLNNGFSLDELGELAAEKIFESSALRSSASGALAAGIAERAISIAMKRDIENKRSVPTGLTDSDLISAVEHVRFEMEATQ